MMTNYELILQKITRYTRKFYTNELLRGVILFLAIGLLYFLFTLFVEYFLWLKPLFRTVLFWTFLFFELLLLYRFILIPVLKIFGLRKGISPYEASRLIGNHFPEIDDKLLNMLQLHESHVDSELVMASIDQKADNLKPFSFQKAIDFTHNKKYIKYLMIPISIWLIFFISGYEDILSGSYNRLVHHQQEFVPPAPFSFRLLNDNLKVLEGNSLDLKIEIVGNTLPEEVSIILDNQKYFLQQTAVNQFIYTLSDIKKNTDIQFVANNVSSKIYQVEVVPIPQIQSINLQMHYPSHLNKKDEIISNTGNAIVPEGTLITWKISTKNASSVMMIDSLKSKPFEQINNSSTFQLRKEIRNNYEYIITTSNASLKEFEKLPFSISVVKDAFPEIHIETDIDSLNFGEAHFVGRVSDDYGLSKLQVIYYPLSNPNQKMSLSVPIKNGNISDFYLAFPSQLNLKDGLDYELYFEIFDNDRVNGFKSVKSKTYSYHKDSEVEFNEKIIEQQEKNIENIDKLLNKQEKNQQELDALQKQLQNKSDLNFNETQQIQQLLKRQQQYEEMMQRQSDELKQNLDIQPKTDNEMLNQKKEDIQKRIDELKQTEEEKKLLEELQKLADKLKKEDLLDNIQKLSANNKQKEKSLEQLLELTKRFYVEQKAQQIAEKLDELSKKQEDLKNSESNSKESQDKLNEEFKKIQEDIKDMMEQNSELKEPMSLDEQKLEQQSVNQDMQQASEQLQNKQKTNAQKKQQSAANKMKQMSQNMKQMMMDMQGDMIEEDIASLRRIVKNLITFSYKQEDLMNTLQNEQQSETNLSANLKKQNQLKTYFEHIDDSLYTLSMRQAKLSNKINEFLANAHYYLDASNQSLAEGQITKTRSNQQFVMTAANDLASMLSSLLDNLQNPPPAMGQGSGKGQSGQSFSLPDIIQKQGDIKQRMQNMLKESEQGQDAQQGEKQGEQQGQKGKGNSEKSNQDNGEKQSKELYEIYKQQEELRQALEQQLEDLKGSDEEKQAANLIRQMDQLEQMLLEKGITNEVLKKIMNLEHELLKLKNATYEQNQEEKRISNTNKKEFSNTPPKYIEDFYKKLNEQEMLNKDPFPFQSQINKKVIQYFNQ